MISLGVALLTAGGAMAYPIEPVPLWSLTEQATLIVIAEVVEVERIERAEGDWNTKVAHLRVIETLKGINRLEVVVPFPAALTCPMPPRYFEGRTVVAFLRRWDEAWSTIGLSYGTLYPRGAALDEVTTMIQEALDLQRSPSTPERLAADRHAWHVRAAILPGTRWHGLYELVKQANPRAAAAGDLPAQQPLSDADRRRLAKALVEAPSQGRTMAMMLRTLGDHADDKVDALVVGTVDAALAEPTPPLWTADLLWAVLERWGDEGRAARLRSHGLDPWDIPSPEVLRAIWADARAPRDIPVQADP